MNPNLAESMKADYGGNLKWFSYCLRTMALDGFNPMTDSAVEFFDHEHEGNFRWIVENRDTPDRAKLARCIAEWIEFEIIAGRFNSIDRLARSIKSGTYREEVATPAVLMAVACFIDDNGRWPARAEIALPDISRRSIDLSFQHIQDELCVEIDGRVRWTDPQ